MAQSAWAVALNGLFLLTAVALVVVRQVQACLAAFVLESALLAASAFISGRRVFAVVAHVNRAVFGGAVDREVSNA
jgi:hypothetical protein